MAIQPIARPAGVIAIAVVVFATSGYLAVLGLVLVAAPGAVSLTLGTPLLGGLALAGPYMFLLFAAVGGLLGLGLLRLSNLARRATILVALIGVVMLAPKAFSAAEGFSPALFLTAAMILFRVIVVWYLWQGSTEERFLRQ